MTFGHWQKRRKKIDISTFPSWGIVNPVRRPSPRCETFVADERSVSDKARPVARDGCYRLNPIINRAFSVCLCIVSSYLLVALFLLKLSLTLSLSHTHTHSTALWCWQLFAVCTASASSTLSHPTRPVLHPGNRSLWWPEMDGWMNSLVGRFSLLSRRWWEIFRLRRSGGRRYRRHPHGVGVYRAIMTVSSEGWSSEASVTPPQKINILEHTHIAPYNGCPLP